MLHTTRVLIVDDSSFEARLLRRALERVGAPVVVGAVGSAEEALRELRRSDAAAPELMIVDRFMPGMGGLALIQTLRAERDALPVVIMWSNAPTDSDVAACYGLGVNAFVLKPFDMAGYQRLAERLCEFWLGVASLPRHDDATALSHQ